MARRLFSMLLSLLCWFFVLAGQRVEAQGAGLDLPPQESGEESLPAEHEHPPVRKGVAAKGERAVPPSKGEHAAHPAKVGHGDLQLKAKKGETKPVAAPAEESGEEEAAPAPAPSGKRHATEPTAAAHAAEGEGHGKAEEHGKNEEHGKAPHSEAEEGAEGEHGAAEPTESPGGVDDPLTEAADDAPEGKGLGLVWFAATFLVLLVVIFLFT